MGVLRRTAIMKLTGEVPAEAKFTIAVRRIHLARRPYAKRRRRPAGRGGVCLSLKNGGESAAERRKRRKRKVLLITSLDAHSSSSSNYSPHRCKFNSKRQSSTLNSIQKDKKGPRFPRQIAPTRKWTHSSCISLSRESLLHTPVHPRIPAALIAAVG